MADLSFGRAGDAGVGSVGTGRDPMERSFLEHKIPGIYWDTEHPVHAILLASHGIGASSHVTGQTGGFDSFGRFEGLRELASQILLV